MADIGRRIKNRVVQVGRGLVRPYANRLFFENLIRQTGNFSDTTWLDYPIWQNTLDLWLIQEAISAVKPALLIETGTNKGGSARFYAHLFDLLDQGRVLTVDIEKMHDLSHPRIEFLIGGSVDEPIIQRMQDAAADAQGPVMVILDSDHSQPHVAAELDVYAHLITVDSLMLVQDGVIDVLPIFSADRPGPLPAIKAFLAAHPEFVVDPRFSDRFLITHHPLGWLRRIR